MRILVIEDDDVLLGLLTRQLSGHNYAIDGAIDGKSGWEYASTYKYDLIILDVLLPLIDGISLCQKLRQAGYTIPILMLTSQDTSQAKIVGLDAGADDYMVKPFDEAELIARIRALLRRGSSNPLPIITWGDLWLNSNSHEVSYAGAILELTAKEYGLLEMMLRESQHVFSKEEILESLWSSEEFPVDATVRSHMRRLRNKLTSIGAPQDLISTSHGRGYYLKPEVSPAELESPCAPPQPKHLRTIESATSDDTLPQSISSGHNLSATTTCSPQDTGAQQQQAQYWELLNRTWQSNRSRCD
jgi:DNA-binding response OmpR family regulator